MMGNGESENGKCKKENGKYEKENGKWIMRNGKCEKEKVKMKNIYCFILTKELLPLYF